MTSMPTSSAAAALPPAPSGWLPRPHWRLLAVWRRNLLVWRKMAKASVLAHIAEPLINFVAFGYGLGMWVKEVEGVPYIAYLATGVICSSTMMSASFESLYSAFSRMHVQRTWEGLLLTPLSIDDVVAAELLWAATKGMMTATAIMLVIVLMGLVEPLRLLAAWPVLALLALCFSAIGLVFNALAKGYDFFTYYFTLIATPMMFIGGVYYPGDAMPGWLAQLGAWLPLGAAVQVVRPIMLGQPDQIVWSGLWVLVVFGLAAWALANHLTHKRLS